jgi:hypothetical protein
MKRIPAWLPLAMALVPVACNCSLDPSRTSRLRVGEATPTEAEALLGRPAGTAPDGKGGTVLRWENRFPTNVGGGTLTVVSLRFGPDGKLADKQRTTEDIPPVLKQEPGGGGCGGGMR